MEAFVTGLEPLAGGYSGETFVTRVAGEQVVARVYGPRSAWRGPRAPEIDAAVLRLVSDLLPVPDVLEARPADPRHDLPGLLLVSRLPGERLDLVLPGLAEEQQGVVGRRLGTVAGRLGHMVQPRAGLFTDPSLAVGDLPAGSHDALAWVQEHAAPLREVGVDPTLLGAYAEHAQTLLDEQRRVVLVHADLNPKNVLVDADSLELTGIVDWEFAHCGSPYADLGNLLREDTSSSYAEGVLTGYRAMLPRTPDDVVERAAAADLFALVDLAARAGSNPAVEVARERLRALAQAGWTPAGGRR